MDTDFEKELEALINKMDSKQLTKFLTVSAARHTVYFSEYLFEQSYYLTPFLISLCFNFILSNDHVHGDCARFYRLCWDLDYDDPALECAIKLHVDSSPAHFLVARARALPFVRALALVRAPALAFDLDLDLALHLAFALARKSTMLNDAKVILNNSNYFVNNSFFFDKELSKFLDNLKKLNGEYWADLFKRAFNNNFQLEQKDIDAILSLNISQMNTTITESSVYLSEFVIGSTDSNEIRLMILGKKGEGKTSFARRFQNLNEPMPKPKESTEGVDVKDFVIDGVTIKIWDFAGHEVTHAAHKFFLSDKCVYVIVCQARQGESIINTKIEYWLEHIRDYAGGDKDSQKQKSTVFILINEWDNNTPSINIKSIEMNYPEYELYFTHLNIAQDNDEGGNLARFNSTLVEYIKTIDTKIPASYCLMRERINKTFESKNFVQKDDIIKIIEELKVQDKNRSRQRGNKNTQNNAILKNLHDLAFCFWFDKVKEANTVVLKPRWITGAVYKIINWVKNAEPYNNAAIRISDFEEALRHSPEDEVLFPPDKDKLIFDIMKQFELAYSEDNETLIIPHCLKDSYPDNEVGLTFDFDNTVQVEISVESKDDMPIPEFPINLIPRFIVKKYFLIYKNNNGNSITSKNKAMFLSSDGKSYAEIKRNERDNFRVYITVQGKNKTINLTDNVMYLKALVSDFDLILSEHKRFQECKPTLSYRATDVNGKPFYLTENELINNSVRDIEKFKKTRFRKEEYERMPQIVNNFNTYNNYGQAGAMGEKASSKNNSFNQQINNFFDNVDMDKLKSELTQLRTTLIKPNTTPEQYIEIAHIAEAELNCSVEKKDKLIVALKKCGKWVWDQAKEIGVEIAAEALKKTFCS
jgi:GTPase SAR1 family protein/flagellar hook-basal body complex protein FliE